MNNDPNNNQNNMQMNMQGTNPQMNAPAYGEQQMYQQPPQGMYQQPQGMYQQPMPQKRKKRHGCLVTFLVLLGCLVFVGIAVALFGGGDSKTTEDANVPADGLYHVGDVYKGDGINITYEEFGEYTGYDEWSEPAEGKKVVYAKFSVENVSDDNKVVSYWDFNGYCENQEVSQYYGMDNSGLDFSLDLSAGRSGKGTVAFEIPEDVTDLSQVEIEFSPNFWTDERIKFAGE